MNTIKFFLIIQIFFGLIVSSCSIVNTNEMDELDGTKWELLFIRKSILIPDSTISIEFEKGKIRGNSGCNTYFSDYEIEGTQISFREIAATEMACSNPEGIMQQEHEYLAFLSDVVTYSIQGDRLILKKEYQDQLTYKRIQDK